MLRRLATSRDRVVRRPHGRRGACSGTRRLLLLALCVCAERGRHRDAWLDGLVQITERELEGAEVRDANELPFHLPLATCHDRVVVVAQDTDEIARIDARWRTERGYDRRRVTVVCEELEIDGLETPPRRACEIAVPANDGLEALLGHETERLLQRDEDGDRRGRRCLRLLEGGLVRG